MAAPHAPSVRTISGDIVYLSAARGEIGREAFIMDVRADGGRSFTAYCEMDEAEVRREVSATLAPDWRPRDAVVRLAKGGVDFGAGFYAFTETEARLVVAAPDGGVHTETRALNAPVPFFGGHPILNDGFWAAYHPGGAKPVTVRGAVTNSFAPDGASGLELLPFDFTVEHLGTETVSVPAGQFETRHSAVTLPGVAEPFHIWTFGDDCIVVKELWAAVPDETYELARLEVKEK